MATLLTINQQQAIKKISSNNEAKYTQIATEVENKELRDLLGTALLQSLQAAPTQADNAKLLNGDTFTDCNDNTITHRGLRFVLAYLNYVRYIGESFINDTFTGFVQKTRPDSEIISEGSIKRLQQENKEIALSEWALIKEYLITNSATFTLYNQNNTKQLYRPKFTTVRKTAQ
jgi:hypothetical protein